MDNIYLYYCTVKDNNTIAEKIYARNAKEAKAIFGGILLHNYKLKIHKEDILLLARYDL